MTSSDAPPPDDVDVSDSKNRFWRQKSLDQMSNAEWESLCDGCGKCCLIKLVDDDTEELHHTRVSCELLDIGSCRCSNYDNRHDLVPDCIQLSSKNIEELEWLPETCAYRLVGAGKDLHWWHPLVSGDPETVHLAGISVRDWAISETKVVHDYEPYLLKKSP